MDLFLWKIKNENFNLITFRSFISLLAYERLHLHLINVITTVAWKYFIWTFLNDLICSML